MAGDFFIQAYEWWSGPGSCLAFSKTPNGGPGVKSQKKFNLEDFKSIFYYIILLFYCCGEPLDLEKKI